jgi:hypothetical protein
VAVKVTPVPEQTEVADEAMDTEEICIGFTVKFTPVDVAGLPTKQLEMVPPAVNTAFTTSPFVGVYE